VLNPIKENRYGGTKKQGLIFMYLKKGKPLPNPSANFGSRKGGRNG